MKAAAAGLLLIACAAPSAAQTTQSISIRPFVMVSGEQFSAKKTFEAAFGQASQPFFGGGIEIAAARGFFVDVTASRFKKTGERAFVYNGTTFPLDIPLTVSLTPLELTAGYRFHLKSSGKLVPYLGAGVGTYAYKESSPADVSEANDNVSARHTGFLAVGGLEYRAHRVVGVSLDVQFTSITGVLGSGGLSEQFKEKNLGGLAARFRVLVGR